MSNLELQVDSRMKQGLYPRVGDVKRQTMAVLSPDGVELYVVAIGGGIRCVNTSSGTEKWIILTEVGVELIPITSFKMMHRSSSHVWPSRETVECW